MFLFAYLYSHLPPITKTIQVRRTRHAGHCWRSRDELISDVLLWTPTHGRAKAGRPARTYIQQLCEDTGCSPEDLPEAMNDREKVAREGQGYPCYQHDMMMMMMMMIDDDDDDDDDMMMMICLSVKFFSRKYFGAAKTKKKKEILASNYHFRN